jgi:hypothetical protein
MSSNASTIAALQKIIADAQGALVALGLAAAYGGSLLPPVPGQQVGPNVFPMVIGLALYFVYGYKHSVLRRGNAPVSPE